MQVKIERFKNSGDLLSLMEIAPTVYSLKEIANYAERRLNSYASQHKDEIIKAMERDDYEIVPEIPSFDDFYFNQLAPRIDKRMNQSGCPREEIEEMVGHFYACFFYTVIPTVLRKHEREKTLAPTSF